MGEETLEKFSRKFIHDIRTPISVLNMLSDLFKNSQVGEEDLSIMNEELAKMQKLVEDYAEGMKEYYSQ